MNRSGESEARTGPSDRELDQLTPRTAGGREVRVGVFVLLGALAFGVVLFLMTDPATFRGRYMVTTEVADAGGIRRGDPVQMRGVNIGRVDQFDLTPGGVLITLEIEGEWRIPEDSRAVLGGLDLLGGRTVQVIRGDSDAELQIGQVMPGAAEEGVMELADTLGDEARSTMARVRALMADTAVASVHTSIVELEKVLGNISEITDGQRAQLSELSASLSRSANRVEDLATREELDRSLARADSTLAALQIASTSPCQCVGLPRDHSRPDGAWRGNPWTVVGRGWTLREPRRSAGRDARSWRATFGKNPDRYINLRIF